MHSSFFLRNVISRCALMTAAATIPVALAPLGDASTYTLTTLHSFSTEANCGDGDTPLAGLLTDVSGNLFGTGAAGGANGDGGTVFELKP